MCAAKRKRSVIKVDKNRHRIKAREDQAKLEAEEAALKASKKNNSGSNSKATKKAFKETDNAREVLEVVADEGDDNHADVHEDNKEGDEERTDADRELIETFHVVQKQISQIENTVLYNVSATEKEKDEAKHKVKGLQNQLKDLGGLAAYQKASVLGEAAGGGFDSSRFVLQELVEILKLKNKRSDGNVFLPEAKLLDVGAIIHRYTRNDVARVGTKLDALSIDLETNLADKKVRKVDFFDFAPLCLRGEANTADADATQAGAQKRKADGDKDRSVKPHCFDIVVLSLVLNFVPDPRKRAEMLLLTRELLSASSLGIMFLVLPSACVDNSRYLSEELFKDIVEACGFKIRSSRHSKNGKLFFAVCQIAELYKAERKVDKAEKRLLKEVRYVENASIKGEELLDGEDDDEDNVLGSDGEYENEEGDAQDSDSDSDGEDAKRVIKYPRREVNRTRTKYDNGSYNNFCIIVKRRGKQLHTGVAGAKGKGSVHNEQGVKRVKLTAREQRKTKVHAPPTEKDVEERGVLTSNMRKKNRKHKKYEARQAAREEREANKASKEAHKARTKKREAGLRD
ncbi:hypothetical protein SARC_03110 [Sphaeroforma arctica JP610]|uniref:Uncharacterized protein n=1 Tax=Sphaeroforma arctica JP610 TaxID=667725 RepID=A0A0L0G732_9EUKA|nr:hypothetical protein SARC_03110 [Sphaeroforma arctica JP610]KNC84676.1 hypothetical protein SARC_03110 [Sphaeroforma arctica JP610]|eukprot:XP_014158578.1 hypothetical protein SARC_03110 [Sphaeroforma arctica JP610]